MSYFPSPPPFVFWDRVWLSFSSHALNLSLVYSSAGLELVPPPSPALIETAGWHPKSWLQVWNEKTSDFFYSQLSTFYICSLETVWLITSFQQAGVAGFQHISASLTSLIFFSFIPTVNVVSDLPCLCGCWRHRPQKETEPELWENLCLKAVSYLWPQW